MKPTGWQMDSFYNWLGLLGSVAMFGWILWRYFKVLPSKPHFRPADVIFQDWFASGCSQKNIFTKLGGARNCLRLVVTRRFLWVTSWFPFSLVAVWYDLEHLIPLESILSISYSSFWGRRTILLTYQDALGDQHTLRLLPKKTEEFIRSLGVDVAKETGLTEPR
jgi:hypothetical protein